MNSQTARMARCVAGEILVSMPSKMRLFMLASRVVVSFSTGHVLLAICTCMSIVAPQTTLCIDIVYRFFVLLASNKKVTSMVVVLSLLSIDPITLFTSTTSVSAKSISESLGVLLLCISNSDGGLYRKN